MTYEQFARALNYANAIRSSVKEKLKKAGWQEFEVTLSFEVDIDDSEEASDYSEFVFECYVRGLKEYITFPIQQFLNDTIYLQLFKIIDDIKDYFIEEFSY